MGRIRNKYFGNRAFYASALAIALPIAVQNCFTNFVNLLDNVMVGQMGTLEMSGVSISNQLLFVCNLCIFGTVSGGGIFCSQFFGKEDDEGIRNTIRFKLMLGSAIITTAILIFIFFGKELIGLFLSGEKDAMSVGVTLEKGYSYLRIMTLGLPGFLLSQVYASTLREGGETLLPMRSGIIAIITNLCLNYVLIFGHFGFPRLGVDGAAIATVISRYVEAGIIIVKSRKYSFFKGLYRTLFIPLPLFKRIFRAAIPLMLNETFWSLAMSTLVQCYSTRGINAVAGYNIANTINQVANSAFMAVGSSIGIIIGNLLGAGKAEEAVDTDRKLIVFSMMVGAVTGALLLIIAPLFPMLYNTTHEARTIAAEVIMIQGLFLPLFALRNASYFTLRSGGKILITILTDSLFMWMVPVPLAFALSRFTALSVPSLFAIVQSSYIFNCIVGIVLIKKRVWVRNIVS
ncbi:MAG: MATE family efflux transporter [Bullifex sp.]